MTAISSPKEAEISINDLLDNCAKIKSGQEVLLIAHLDGLHDSDNMVDWDVISIIESAIKIRGAKASTLWIDEVAKPNAWRFPPIVKAAMKAADVSILHSFDITFEEIVELKQFVHSDKIRLIRNFATTVPLLCTSWAQTPYELVSAIRYQAALSITEGASWWLSDDNGTFLEGKILPALSKEHPWFTKYAITREEGNGYIPWPEWVVTPIRVSETNGGYIFDRMLSWWSRYIGISPYFVKPVKLNIENNKIVRIEGGDEAEAIRQFLAIMQGRLGEGVYDFNCFHFGVHPQAMVSSQECPNILHRRMIEHSYVSNLHAHIGAPAPTADYPYWMHCTGDIRQPTLKVGDALVYDKGHLIALDDPVVRAVAAKYPGRPGLEPIIR